MLGSEILSVHMGRELAERARELGYSGEEPSTTGSMGHRARRAEIGVSCIYDGPTRRNGWSGMISSFGAAGAAVPFGKAQDRC